MSKDRRPDAPNRIRRLFFDIETSPNIGYFWKPGRKISIGYENILHERSMICAVGKWEGDPKVHRVHWTVKGQDDRRVAKQVSDWIAQADEIVAHNGNRFDIPWVRTRCLHHGFPFPPRIVSQDTCALARRLFEFNSNRLDYVAQRLGVGGKMETGGFDLWKRVVAGDREALDKMVSYCERDVLILEAVWQKMMPYVPAKSRLNKERGECPECGNQDQRIHRRRMTGAGTRMIQLHCPACGKFHTVPARVIDK